MKSGKAGNQAADRGGQSDNACGKTPKAHVEGTHRLVSPEETWRRIEPLFPRFGITRVADLTGLDRIGLPVAAAVRPQSRSVAVSAGKGLSLAAAKVSAAMEAIECAHAETIDRPLVFASRSEIAARHRPADILDLPRVDGTRLTADTRFLWMEAIEIATGEPVMVPYELVHAHYCPDALPAAGTFLATTNGLASGNAYAEAVCHGLFEVIERDALNLWERLAPRQRNDRLVAHAFADAPHLGETMEQLGRAGFQIAIWDITSDIGVPAFHCLIVDEQDPAGHPGTGTGCHPDKTVALYRALSEAAQVRAVYISGGRDDITRREYQSDHIQAFRRTIEAGGKAPRRDFAAIASTEYHYFEDDIAWTARRLEEVGCGPILVADLSLPDTGIFVVRVIVPGLEGPPEANAVAGRRAQEAAR
ncbi:YcaO-like family protein [Mesorhizobium xinjiangense]|uniref:YcaO-like family protein n=1 Tax=Mesorhizobium xinjiangense TaxID=2678685 RepID=UPI0012EECE5E|nr:YcaO-like family protein [Mesorhizobium xinjiangense]